MHSRVFTVFNAGSPSQKGKTKKEAEEGKLQARKVQLQSLQKEKGTTAAGACGASGFISRLKHDGGEDARDGVLGSDLEWMLSQPPGADERNSLTCAEAGYSDNGDSFEVGSQLLCRAESDGEKRGRANCAADWALRGSARRENLQHVGPGALESLPDQPAGKRNETSEQLENVSEHSRRRKQADLQNAEHDAGAVSFVESQPYGGEIGTDSRSGGGEAILGEGLSGAALKCCSCSEGRAMDSRAQFEGHVTRVAGRNQGGDEDSCRSAEARPEQSPTTLMDVHQQHEDSDSHTAHEGPIELDLKMDKQEQGVRMEDNKVQLLLMKEAGRNKGEESETELPQSVASETSQLQRRPAAVCMETNEECTSKVLMALEPSNAAETDTVSDFEVVQPGSMARIDETGLTGGCDPGGQSAPQSNLHEPQSCALVSTSRNLGINTQPIGGAENSVKSTDHTGSASDCITGDAVSRATVVRTECSSETCTRTGCSQHSGSNGRKQFSLHNEGDSDSVDRSERSTGKFPCGPDSRIAEVSAALSDENGVALPRLNMPNETPARQDYEGHQLATQSETLQASKLKNQYGGITVDHGAIGNGSFTGQDSGAYCEWRGAKQPHLQSPDSVKKEKGLQIASPEENDLQLEKGSQIAISKQNSVGCERERHCNLDAGESAGRPGSPANLASAGAGVNNGHTGLTQQTPPNTDDSDRFGNKLVYCDNDMCNQEISEAIQEGDLRTRSQDRGESDLNGSLLAADKSIFRSPDSEGTAIETGSGTRPDMHKEKEKLSNHVVQEQDTHCTASREMKNVNQAKVTDTDIAAARGASDHGPSHELFAAETPQRPRGTSEKPCKSPDNTRSADSHDTNQLSAGNPHAKALEQEPLLSVGEKSLAQALDHGLESVTRNGSTENPEHKPLEYGGVALRRKTESPAESEDGGVVLRRRKDGFLNYASKTMRSGVKLRTGPRARRDPRLRYSASDIETLKQRWTFVFRLFTSGSGKG